MTVKQFEIWVADLNPRMGTEAGKTRPVLIVQTNLLNKFEHPSTLICPITSNVLARAQILRVHLPEGAAGLTKDSDVMIDQLRAIDNQRLKKRIGILPAEFQLTVKECLRAVLDLL
ncbi:MAG: type II toxin-antitoxin system PemK/MazF family toxin [Spirochaetales bacterium]|uniref:mRNA interferase n=1 Tax=Candidatus Thalassospirochaeta sargassi TaxID=3119039 RepID=A0AAJ1IGY7_9SPIO|nr:type II toxin-antitoxin system PemK/MazF family toxin [Spirochaetales bacterium]